MTTREFIERWYGVDDGIERSCSSVFKDGKGNIYSYGYHYPLLFTLNGQTFRNVHGYSVTTAKHIGWCYGFNAIDVDLPSSFRLSSDEAYDYVQVKRALRDKANRLRAELDAKKRTDTKVYQWLKSDWKRAERSLQAVC